MDQIRQLESLDPTQLADHEYEPHVSWLDAADGSQWGHVVMQLAVGARSEASYMRDPEAIRCAETGYSPKDIYLGARQYTDVSLGMLDGPVRDNPKGFLDQFQWTARTPKASLTKRQRAKLRKAKRAAKRKGVAFDEEQFIAVSIIKVS